MFSLRRFMGRGSTDGGWETGSMVVVNGQDAFTGCLTLTPEDPVRRSPYLAPFYHQPSFTPSPLYIPMSSATPSTSSTGDKYRGAVIEVRPSPSFPQKPLLTTFYPPTKDLQLPPAFSVVSTESISRVIES